MISGRRVDDRVSARHDLGCRHLPAAGPAGPPGPATRHPRAGDRLPTAQQVVAKLAINPNTVLKAYRDLEREGLVRPRPGQGTFVVGTLPRSDPAVQERFLASMTAWLRKARAAGLGPDDVEAIYRTAVRASFAEGAA